MILCSLRDFVPAVHWIYARGNVSDRGVVSRYGAAYFLDFEGFLRSGLLLFLLWLILFAAITITASRSTPPAIPPTRGQFVPWLFAGCDVPVGVGVGEGVTVAVDSMLGVGEASAVAVGVTAGVPLMVAEGVGVAVVVGVGETAGVGVAPDECRIVFPASL